MTWVCPLSRILRQAIVRQQIAVTFAAPQKQTLEKLASCIASLPLPMFITSDSRLQNILVSANDAFLDATGYSSIEVLGETCLMFVGPATESGALTELRQAFASDRPTIVELISYRKNGAPFSSLVTIAPVINEMGRASFFVGTLMDARIGGHPSGPRKDRVAAQVGSLTPRLRQVLELLCAGFRNREMATFLNIHEKTVKMHRERLLDALGVKTSAEAIRIGVEADVLLNDPAISRTGR